MYVLNGDQPINKIDKMETKNQAFSLIEIMVAIAIVGILAAVVLVSMRGYGEKARASRALAQASSVIPSMVSCWVNATGTEHVDSSDPTSGGGDICDISSSYGQWPALPSPYTFSAVTGTSASSFFFTVSGESQTICCNSAMKSCGIITGACGAGTTW